MITYSQPSDSYSIIFSFFTFFIFGSVVGFAFLCSRDNFIFSANAYFYSAVIGDRGITIYMGNIIIIK